MLCVNEEKGRGFSRFGESQSRTLLWLPATSPDRVVVCPLHSAQKTSQSHWEIMAMKRPSKLHLKSIQALDLDQIVANLERTVLETEKKVERIISRGPTPRNLKTNYQKNVPDANGRRIEDIRKTLRGARRSLHVLLRRQRGLMKESTGGEKASPSKEVNIKIIPKKTKTYATASVQTEETSLVTASTQTQTIKEPVKSPRGVEWRKR